MEIAGSFERVSLEQYAQDHGGSAGPLKAVWQAIPLPVRATAGSAGYDFFLPEELTLAPQATARIATGIRAKMNEGWVLLMFPRSSLGFKHQLMLDNTVGVIDADYYQAANEGHILVQLTNHSGHAVTLKAHDRFAQGVFVPFGITDQDQATAQRSGGFGSTDAPAGQTVVLSQRCNPTTGYDWYVTVKDESIVAVESEYHQDEHEEGMAGVGGTTRFTFTGLKPGRTEVILTYMRPWQQGNDLQLVYAVTVGAGLDVAICQKHTSSF
jgi:dUTP pyrophosphatase